MAFITRFAPSPTGRLHLGHAYSALLNYDAAQAAGGVMHLRIEDIDQTRARDEFEQAIYDDLRWLGVEWPEPVRRQSDHFSFYAKALEPLIEGGLVYRCFKTRKEILDEITRAPHLSPEGPDGPAYIGAPLTALEERSLLAEGTPFAWRLSMERAARTLGAGFHALTVKEEIDGEITQTPANPEVFGDVVIARKDAGTSYHLACVADDAFQGVTHVIRGEDLRPAAALHRLLQALLGLPSPIYRHHRLILDESGKRLAKRAPGKTIEDYRDRGATPADLRELIGLPPS